MSVAGNAAAVTQSFGKGLSQHNPGILYRMVAVHDNIPHHLQIQIDTGMNGEGGNHVVKKADAGIGVAEAIAIQI